MAEHTDIGWVGCLDPEGVFHPGHTFNPWWGCCKVSPGCQHCYAEHFADKRLGKNLWGPPATTRRQIMSDTYWQQPARWNQKAAERGIRTRVFCASMADVFEHHPDVKEARERLWQLIRATPNLDWLLLTKRPEHILGLLPWSWGRGWPNVWLGTSAETQEYADQRLPTLLKVPAAIHFVSAEPLLGPLDLTAYLSSHWMPAPITWRLHRPNAYQPALSWVIVGGESGPQRREMDLDWARSLRDQCAQAGVPFFFKQTGGHKGGSHLLDGERLYAWPGDDVPRVPPPSPAAEDPSAATSQQLSLF